MLKKQRSAGSPPQVWVNRQTFIQMNEGPTDRQKSSLLDGLLDGWTIKVVQTTVAVVV